MIKTPEDLHAQFRSDMRDEQEPYLWSDEDIYEYMDDAQKMFCVLTGGIADVLSTQYVAGQEFVDYSERILKLREVRDADGRPVQIQNFEQHQGCAVWPTATGRVSGVVTGMKDGKMRLSPLPQHDGNLSLVVYRLPLTDIEGPDGEFEIDSRHVRHLLDWMKSRALSKADAETFDKGKADEHGGKFAAYCDRAKADRERREHTYRTIGYGGI